MLTTIDLGYRSRPQFVPFHQRAQRWACIVAHRRAGKTVACIMDLVDAALRCRKTNARFAYIAPHYNQAKDVAWTYLKQYTAPLPHVTINESELRIDLPANGARLRLYGADNYDRMRGVYFDGVILDEYADMDPRAWSEVVRPALSDRKGWATFIGTPKGKNAFQEDPEAHVHHCQDQNHRCDGPEPRPLLLAVGIFPVKQRTRQSEEGARGPDHGLGAMAQHRKPQAPAERREAVDSKQFPLSDTGGHSRADQAQDQHVADKMRQPAVQKGVAEKHRPRLRRIVRPPVIQKTGPERAVLIGQTAPARRA